MTIEIRKANEDVDDLEKITRILFKAPIHNQPFAHFSEEETTEMIPFLMREKNTEYSIDNIWVCYDNNKLAAVVHAYDTAKIEPIAAGKTYMKHFGLKFSIKYRVWREYIKPINNVGTTFFIQNIAFTDGYSKSDLAPVLINSIISDLDKKYNFIHTDIALEMKENIDFMKTIGFMPLRVLYNCDQGKPLARINLELAFWDGKGCTRKMIASPLASARGLTVCS